MSLNRSLLVFLTGDPWIFGARWVRVFTAGQLMIPAGTLLLSLFLSVGMCVGRVGGGPGGSSGGSSWR